MKKCQRILKNSTNDEESKYSKRIELTFYYFKMELK